MKKIITLMVLGLIISTSTALAHKVIVFAWVEQGRIHVEGSFGPNRPAKNCEIQVKSPKGILVHRGTTDAQGMYSFEIPDHPDSDLIVEMNAGPGHSGKWTISENELVAQPTPDNLERKMAEKKSLEKSPSLTRILSGIGIIFGLAFVAARVKKRVKKRKNNA